MTIEESERVTSKVGSALSSPISRRRLIIGGAAASMAVLGFSGTGTAEALVNGGRTTAGDASRRASKDQLLTRDGKRLFFKDWGNGQPIVFSHGWPLSADAWDAQMLFFGQHGFRVIAHDRRGHGRSEQPWQGNNMNQYADDLSDLFDALDLRNAILIGHSTGAGEVVRFVGRHGTPRLSKVVLISSITPLRLRTASNPGGAPLSAFDDVRTSVVRDRSQFLRELSLPFFGYNRPGVAISQGVRDELWREGMQASIVASFDGIRTQSETDFTDDLRKINIPTLLLHGEDDQLVPISSSVTISSALVKHSSMKIYPGAPHGLTVVKAELVNSDVLSFIRSHG